jgi:Asp-tRNA(Asn)/Glu-tRNA(Gln) amidotransferase A subunit family amidase
MTQSSRRDFLIVSAMSVGAVAGRTSGQRADGPVTRRTFVEGERLAGVKFTDPERAMLIESIDEHLERLQARQELGPIPLDWAPALVFDPRLPGRVVEPPENAVDLTLPEPPPLPSSPRDIAFAPLTTLAAWIRDRRLTSEALTRLYLERLERLGPQLECVVTLTPELAMEQARRADAEIAAGRYLGPLHGIPWGAKDLLDTAGIRTTFGATPYRLRVPDRNAAVVDRLERAGAVLVAKLTLGALAYGDRWYAGRTRNPWNREQGSSGSSAGSAAATAAGLVGFSIGTETYGSIVSPSVRCGTTGLRPTFGRVPRTGAMPLCWSLDKIGPICRRARDCMLVLDAIRGADPGDPASVDLPMIYEPDRPLRRLRLGYAPQWFERSSSAGVLDVARDLGMELREVTLPDWPYDTLLNILYAEAAGAFEHLTRSGEDAELVWQDPEAWPNSFRRSWFIPAVEVVQLDRFRRQVMTMMAGVFDDVHAIISPPFAGSLLLITNHTGHPCLTVRSGMGESGAPTSLTLCGRLYEEGLLCRIGPALEERLGVWDRRPPVD